MTLALYDRVQQTGTANTTVSFTLSGSVAGYQSFVAVGNGNTTYYGSFDTSGNWEVGLGTYSTTGPTLTRTTILSSSNGGLAVTFSGTVNVFITYPSEKSVNQDANGNVTLPAGLTVSSLTDSGLTSGRVTYAGTAGLLQDSANLTFNGTTLTTANDASISGLTVGKGGGSVASNTVVGASALSSNTTGNNNAALSYNALLLNTTGSNNTAAGLNALYSNTTGSQNTAFGRDSLLFNTTASQNTAVGYQAGYSNTTGTSIDAFGWLALYSNTTGLSNCAFGYAVLKSNTTGSNNAAFGTGYGFPSALYYNTTGSANSAFGAGALASNTTASNNTAVGYQAGYSTTSGGGNTFIGYQSGYSNVYPSANTVFNTCVGYQSGYSLAVAYGNTLLGPNSGRLITTGLNNTVIGAYNGNQGGLDIRTASNYIVLSDGDGNPRVSIPTGTATATIPNATGTIMVSGNMPAFSAYPTTTTTVATGTFTKVIFDVKLFDTASCYNTSTSTYTPNVAGYYQINACQGSASAPGANNFICVYKNGSLYTFGSSTGALNSNPTWAYSNLIYMNGTTDYISVYLYQNSGVSINLATNGNWVFSGCLVRSA